MHHDRDVLNSGYKNSLCEVLTTDNKLLAHGRISAISGDTIDLIHKRVSDLPALPFDLPIKINVFNNALGFVVLLGCIRLTKNDLLRVSELRLLQGSERRDYVRAKTETRAFLYKMKGDTPREGLLAPIPAQLEDISLGGLRFSSSQRFESDDNFVIKTAIYDHVFIFQCTIVRVVEANQGWSYYGCRMFGQEDDLLDELGRIIFKLQQEQMQNIRRNA